MALTNEQTLRLLGAIETNSLVFLCGAGLSIPAPTSLPSAIRVSQTCYDKWLPNETTLNPALRDDVDRLAGHFYTRGDFNVFCQLVPWNDLVGPPNKGHSAIADFLVCRAAHAALSANFDPAIEMWAEERKIAMLGALTGQDAITFATVSNPLIKFHGCLRRDRDKTLWTQGQLNENEIQARTWSAVWSMSIFTYGPSL